MIPADELIESILIDLSIKIKEVERNLKEIRHYTSHSYRQLEEYLFGQLHAYQQLQENIKKQWRGK